MWVSLSVMLVSELDLFEESENNLLTKIFKSELFVLSVTG